MILLRTTQIQSSGVENIQLKFTLPLFQYLEKKYSWMLELIICSNGAFN